MQLGEYGGFIWASYGITALVFAGLVWASLRHARRWRRRFEELSRK